MVIDLCSASLMASANGSLRLATSSDQPPAFLQILISLASTSSIPACTSASETSSVSTHSGMPSSRTGVRGTGSLTLAASPDTARIFSASRSALSAPSTSRRMPPALVRLVVTTLTPRFWRLMPKAIFFITAVRVPPSAGRSIVTAAVLGALFRSSSILLATGWGCRVGGGVDRVVSSLFGFLRTTSFHGSVSGCWCCCCSSVCCCCSCSDCCCCCCSFCCCCCSGSGRSFACDWRLCCCCR